MTGFFFGCLLLAVQSVFIGRLCTKAMIRLQGKHGLKHEREAAERSGLAIEALKANDKNAYLAQNSLAKDAYGHSAALAVGKVTASLWPAVAALAWLDLRFLRVPPAGSAERIHRTAVHQSHDQAAGQAWPQA